MVRSFIGLAGSLALTACGGSSGATMLSANVARWPEAPAGQDAYLRLSASRPVDLERYDPASAAWRFVCTTPCETGAPSNGTYRVTSNGNASNPFPIPSPCEPWVVLRVDPDGMVWTRDSPTLRIARAARRWK